MRTGIATNKKRMWPFQIDRIRILRVAQVVNLRSLGARNHFVDGCKLTTCAALDTNAGIAPALEPSNPARPRLCHCEGRELWATWPIKSKHFVGNEVIGTKEAFILSCTKLPRLHHR